VRLKVPIDQISQAPSTSPTCTWACKWRRLLRKRTSVTSKIFIITDGQPTAHVEGDFVYLLYPPDPRSTVATLKEAVLTVRAGARISTFALIEDYWGMDWVGFVDQLTKLTKGVAFYTSSAELSSCIMKLLVRTTQESVYCLIDANRSGRCSFSDALGSHGDHPSSRLRPSSCHRGGIPLSSCRTTTTRA
jgi:hypothetical protein